MTKPVMRGPLASGAAGPAIVTVQAGKNPGQVAFNSVTKLAFVVNNDGTVTVIDASNNASTITVQDLPTNIVVNQVSGNTYVMNSGSNSITVIYKNGSTQNIPTWTSQSDSMALNSSTNKLYVGHFNQACVTVIDLATNYIETIPASYPGFMAIAVNEATNRIYAANMNSDANYVLAIDGKDNSTTTIAVGDYPDSVVVNAAADTIYVGNLHGYSTSVIDGASNTVTATITGIDNGPGPGIVVALNDVTGKIYGITQYRRPPPIYSPKNMFSVIDCAGNTVQQTGQQGFPSVASAVAINTASNRIYTAQGGGNQIQVFDGANPGAVPVQITVGETPMGIAIDPATGTLYVSNWGSNTVSVISGSGVLDR